MRTIASFAASTSAAAAPLAMEHRQEPHSGWHSPVPYLFGGLAAMLGLIAFALLILACSYWKLSGYHESGRRRNEQNEANAAANDARKPEMKAPQCLEERIVVIMAGDEKPTFLATPISSRASSFGDRGSESSESSDKSYSSAEETNPENPAGEHEDQRQEQ